MNTENLIPISYVKQFTPLVKGDELFYKDGGYKFTLKSKVNAALYNNNDDTVDKYYSLVSFADRPNTTGRQPVADDVVINIATEFNGGVPTKAGDYLYWWTDGTIKTWKPNHESMLAKFKEQGANTMFTFENTKEATHIYSNTQFLKIKNGKYEFINSATNFEWEDGGAAEETHFGAMELSRPAGERKEDHTIDGVTTYALTPVRQYDDQETELATHFSGNNNRFYIRGHSMVKKAMVLNNDGHWIYGDCTRNDELDGGEFWKLDGNQVIEPWVGDQLEDLINPASEGCQADKQLKAGDVIEVNEVSELPWHLLSDDKPVFTPPIGSECEVSFVEWTKCYVCGKTKAGLLVIEVDEVTFTVSSALELRPIDNRSDEDKVVDALRELLESLNIDSAQVSEALTDLMSDKFTITLNKD